MMVVGVAYSMLVTHVNTCWQSSGWWGTQLHACSALFPVSYTPVHTQDACDMTTCKLNRYNMVKPRALQPAASCLDTGGQMVRPYAHPSS
jgi:hypothetical protein